VVADTGLTVTDAPVPTKVPPQLPEYHFQLAPVPKLPPLTDSVVLPPLQMVVVPVMAVGAEDKLFTVTVALAHVVLLQSPDALTS